MVDANATTQARDSRATPWIAAAILAVAAIIGWFLYSSESAKLAQADSTVHMLEQERSALQEALDLERDKRQQTENTLLAESEAQSQLRQSLAAEKEAAERLQAQLQHSQQERERLEQELQQDIERLAAESAELEAELKRQLAQQESLNEQIDLANSDRNQLSSRLEEAQDRRQRLLDEIASVNADIETTETALAKASQDIQVLNQHLDQARREQSRLESRVAQLSEQQQQEAAHFEALRQRLEQELNESRVEITQLKNRMTVINLTSEVLFNSGSAEIKPEGRRVLDLIADSLNAYPDRAISIEGHTDNVPIGKNLRYVSNWDLSVTRALAAVDYLQRHNQVSPARLRAVGHGEFKPVASNDTARGRQLNRRIEIHLLADPNSAG